MFFNKSFYRNVLQYMIGFAIQIMQLYETNACGKFEGSFDHISIMFNVN